MRIAIVKCYDKVALGAAVLVTASFGVSIVHGSAKVERDFSVYSPGGNPVLETYSGLSRAEVQQASEGIDGVVELNGTSKKIYWQAITSDQEEKWLKAREEFQRDQFPKRYSHAQ